MVRKEYRPGMIGYLYLCKLSWLGQYLVSCALNNFISKYQSSDRFGLGLDIPDLCDFGILLVLLICYRGRINDDGGIQMGRKLNKMLLYAEKAD